MGLPLMPRHAANIAIAPDHPFVREALLRIVCEVAPTTQKTIIVGAMLMIIAYYGHVPNLRLTLIAAAIIGIAVIRIYVSHYLLARGIAALGLFRASVVFDGLAVLMGFIIATATIFLPPEHDMLRVGFAFALQFAICSGAVVGLAPIRRTFLLFMTSCIAPVVISFLLARSSEQQMMGVMLGFYLAFCFSIADRLNAVFVSNTVLNMHNDTLVNRLRDELNAEEKFIAAVSHEIRTPMNSVVGFVDLLARTPLNREQGAYLDNLRSASARLLKTTNDLLEFKRIEAGNISFAEEAFDLRATVAQQVAIFMPQAAAKSLRLHYELDAEMPANLIGDELRLSQILQNLLSNAIKHTERGQVSIRVAIEDRQPANVELVLKVEDTGTGIPDDRLGIIFQEYQQVNVRRDARQGSGLGLSIVKRLVELQHGNVTVESKLGQGTTFCVRLPCKIADVPRPVPNRGDPSALLATLGPINLLLVDDDELNILVISHYLELADNIAVTTAVDGVQALEEFSKRHYDIVLTDINMPRMDGDEFARRVRADPTRSKSLTPIIAITAGGTAMATIIRDAGIDDYLWKPFTSDDLYSRIAKVLGAKRGAGNPVVG